LLPDTAQEENCRGEVIAIGPGVQQIDVGDMVLIPMTTYVRIMRAKAFDFAVTINGEEKPAVVIPENEITVVWPKRE
jgi:co-chaperonin GroES (HSP10)